MICGYIENVIPVPYIVLLIDWVICQANVLTLWNTSSMCFHADEPVGLF